MRGHDARSGGLHFLEAPPRFLFFTGKGGVGKTSIACATAIELASSGKRVLLVSTDPASNVGQVFGIAIGNRTTVIPEVPNLSALEIDPQAAAEAYRERITGPARGVLSEDAVKGMVEQLSGICTTEVAAFDEFTGFLTDAELVNVYDHVIFDTAPTGHTIRLLQLPGAWSDFLEAGKGDASCLGPLVGLEKQRAQYKAAVDALSDGVRTRLVLVARAQQSALREAARTREELAAIGITGQYLVINGVLPEAGSAGDKLAASIRRREQAVLAAIPEGLRRLPRDEIPLKPFNLVGLEALRGLLVGADVPNAMATTPPAKIQAPSLNTLVDGIAEDGHGLVMVVGKGGVGKTTIAAAIAVELADRGLSVHLSTSDPAAHLAETLVDAPQNLVVSRIDPREETQHYREEVVSTRGARMDAAGRALLEEDLRSPCTEEIAVFQAFSRIIREGAGKFVVMDTAPTGHTLLLLDATGAYHRQAARQMAGSGLRYVTPMMQLQDQKQTKLLIVTLPENTPVLEAAELQAELQRAGVEPWAWVINQSLAAAETTNPLLLRRAALEHEHVAKVKDSLTRRFAVVAMQAEEPIGPARLRSLCAAGDKASLPSA